MGHVGPLPKEKNIKGGPLGVYKRGHPEAPPSGANAEEGRRGARSPHSPLALARNCSKEIDSLSSLGKVIYRWVGGVVV